MATKTIKKTLTRNQVINMNYFLASTNFGDDISSMFRYAKGKNISATENERKIIGEAFPEPKPYTDAMKERIEMLKNDFGVSSDEEIAALEADKRKDLESAVVKFNEEHKEAFDLFKDFVAERDKFLNENVEVDITTVDADLFPAIPRDKNSASDELIWIMLCPMVSGKAPSKVSLARTQVINMNFALKAAVFSGDINAKFRYAKSENIDATEKLCEGIRKDYPIPEYLKNKTIDENNAYAKYNVVPGANIAKLSIEQQDSLAAELKEIEKKYEKDTQEHAEELTKREEYLAKTIEVDLVKIAPEDVPTISPKLNVISDEFIWAAAVQPLLED
jgi:hypothetical protein